MPKGIFIVIDGTDGSGKKTQSELLFNRLKNEGYDAVRAEQPQYGKKCAGPVEEYLNGKYGTADEVGPLRASIFYAIDRYDLSFQIKKWLSAGRIVICDRYAASNMAHQGGKIDDPEKRQLFFRWLDQLEYEIFKIPRPDVNIILHVEAETAQKLVDQKGYRGYLQGAKRDIHENDLGHLKKAENAYLEIAALSEDFVIIKCTQDGKIFPKSKISELVYAETKKIFAQYDLTKELNEEPQLRIKLRRTQPDVKMPVRSDSLGNEIIVFSSDDIYMDAGDKVQTATGIMLEFPDEFIGRVHGEFDGIEALPAIISPENRNEIVIELLNRNTSPSFIKKGGFVARIHFFKK